MPGNNGIIGVICRDVRVALCRARLCEASTIALALLAHNLTTVRGADQRPMRSVSVRMADRQPDIAAGTHLEIRAQDSRPSDRTILDLPDRLKPIGEVVINPGTRPRDYPVDQSASRFAPPSSASSASSASFAWQYREWPNRVHTWESTSFSHRPLYFEDENLERYGRSFGLAQPAVSATHFTCRLIAWPYLLVAVPPQRCIYNLGREPAGSCATYRFYRPPLPFSGIHSACSPSDCEECAECESQ